jgi:hypothetical protein
MTSLDDYYGSTAHKIEVTCNKVRDLLIRKNKAYGNSALEPVRMFSKASPTEQLKVRLDDKLSRIFRGKETEKVPEDTIMDLIGYLILLLIAEQDEAAPQDTPPGFATGGIIRTDPLDPPYLVN